MMRTRVREKQWGFAKKEILRNQMIIFYVQ